MPRPAARAHRGGGPAQGIRRGRRAVPEGHPGPAARAARPAGPPVESVRPAPGPGVRVTADDARLYREYAVWLAHRNMLDYDDLVTKAAELVRTRGDVADAIAARWDYLLVDEFQDVNAVQYDLLRRLAAPHDN